MLQGIRSAHSIVLQSVMLGGLRKWVFLCCLIALGAMVGVNQSVRTFGGGYPHLLSPFHFQNKVSALGKLAGHAIQYPFLNKDKSIRELLRHYAHINKIPYSLVAAVAEAESNLMPYRISSTGAMGVMQLMPGTARDMGVTDPFDPKDNIRGGVRYLKILWKRYRGNKEKIAAAYNWGMGRVSKRKRLGKVPSETRHYIKRVLKLERRYRQRASK
ncbi:MAG: lytic transglycosylase domain-containing protein [Deltaproteobacteria bacterium]|nr:lytic transglycosylase domain-containing protein [Deltaproteobacteria bacterium]